MRRVLVTGGAGFLGSHLVARLRDEGIDPVVVRSRDFDLTDSLTATAGARLAFLYLSRTFPGRSDLPGQTFFTFTPGLTLGLSWRFTTRSVEK